MHPLHLGRPFLWLDNPVRIWTELRCLPWKPCCSLLGWEGCSPAVTHGALDTSVPGAGPLGTRTHFTVLCRASTHTPQGRTAGPGVSEWTNSTTCVSFLWPTPPGEQLADRSTCRLRVQLWSRPPLLRGFAWIHSQPYSQPIHSSPAS